MSLLASMAFRKDGINNDDGKLIDEIELEVGEFRQTFIQQPKMQ